jgi:hypothetical protein
VQFRLVFLVTLIFRSLYWDISLVDHTLSRHDSSHLHPTLDATLPNHPLAQRLTALISPPKNSVLTPDSLSQRIMRHAGKYSLTNPVIGSHPAISHHILQRNFTPILSHPFPSSSHILLLRPFLLLWFCFFSRWSCCLFLRAEISLQGMIARYPLLSVTKTYPTPSLYVQVLTVQYFPSPSILPLYPFPHHPYPQTIPTSCIFVLGVVLT